MIYAFYSFEHRVGRTMALANVAELLSQQGLRVLMVDCDLQSPGLESYFTPPGRAQDLGHTPGLIDLLLDYKSKLSQPLPLETGEFIDPVESIQPYILSIPREGTRKLHLLPAGRRDELYASRVRQFQLTDFMENWEGELFFRWFRNQLNEVADVVLLDLHAGEIESGELWISQLADGITILCALSERSLIGTSDMTLNVTHEKMISLIGRPLDVLVVPARIEYAEKLLLQKFSDEFLSRFARFTSPLIENSKGDLFYKLAIPYIAFFEYSRELAVNYRFIGNHVFDAFENIAGVLRRLIELDRDSQPQADKRTWDKELATSRFLRLRERMTENPSIFISYAREDAETVRILYQRLLDAGFRPWLDTEDMQPGDHWRMVIEEKINKADFVIVCLSKYSTRSRGVFQQEIVWSLDVVQSMPEGKVYLIPVLLEECEIPKRLSNWHCERVFEENGFDKLEKAIRFAGRSEKEI